MRARPSGGISAHPSAAGSRRIAQVISPGQSTGTKSPRPSSATPTLAPPRPASASGSVAAPTIAPVPIDRPSAMNAPLAATPGGTPRSRDTTTSPTTCHTLPGRYRPRLENDQSCSVGP